MEVPMVDVIVAGGGPVGLFLAAELRLAGVDVIVIERLPKPDPAKNAGDRGIQVRSLQTLALRGLLTSIRERAAASGAPGVADFAGDAGADAPEDLRTLIGEWGTQRMKGHFAFLPLMDTDGTLADIPSQLAVWQGHFEQVLEDRARELGARVLRGREVVAVEEDDTGVTVLLDNDSRIRGAYLVGCDGGRSTVRTASGFDFPGTDPAMVALLGQPELDDPTLLTPGVHRMPTGLLFVEPPPGQVVVVEFDVPDRRAPVTVEEFQRGLRRVSGTDVTVRALNAATRVTDNARQVTTYRQGRVLLAGDAAHVHSPMGGQGLNLGLQDAMNLGWKLGLVVRGLVPDTLLDTYTAERHPVAATVLRNTRAQTALLRPSPQTEALREVLADLIDVPATKRHLVEMTSGLAVRYGTHRLTGTFVPERAALAAAGPLRAGRGALLGLEIGGWQDRVESHVDGDAMLVRPDGYVAWAYGDGDVRDALTHWFGSPR
jgi:2-polyprenyl-6-methoxyphenol hydroxylase-like FAD-dependent oxidoreductase